MSTPQPGFMNDIQGNKTSYHDQMIKTQAATISTVYASSEGATGIITAVDLTSVAGFTTLFSTIKVAYHCIIRTDKDIIVRFNLATNDPITIPANTSFDCRFLEIASIFVTAAASASLKVILA
jgi:hypothetical protein